jgi:hypothetical protein
MTRHVTSMSRTFSTCMSQREVIQAQGHAGSNHIRTCALRALEEDEEPVRRVVARPVRAAVGVMVGILSPGQEDGAP